MPLFQGCKVYHLDAMPETEHLAPPKTNTANLTCPHIITADVDPEFAGQECGDEIEVEWFVEVVGSILDDDGCQIAPDEQARIHSLRTWCFHPLTREQVLERFLDHSQGEAERAAERRADG